MFKDRHTYDRKRYAEAKANGKCTKHVHRDAVTGTPWCPECADKRKERSVRNKDKDRARGQRNRQIARDKGHCMSSGCTNKATKGYVTCEVCRSKMSNNGVKRKERGQCSRCKEPLIVGHTMCYYHLWLGVLGGHRPPIPRDVAMKKLEEQNYICPDTGRQLVIGYNCSPDRIDCTRDFGTDWQNLRFIIWDANRAKGALSMADYHQLIIDIAKHKKLC